MAPIAPVPLASLCTVTWLPPKSTVPSELKYLFGWYGKVNRRDLKSAVCSTMHSSDQVMYYDVQ